MGAAFFSAVFGSSRLLGQSKQDYLLLHAQLYLAALLLLYPGSSRHSEVAEIACAALAVPKLSVAYKEWSHSLLAKALLKSGDCVQAEAETRRALELPPTAPLRRLLIGATLIEALLAQGRSAEACIPDAAMRERYLTQIPENAQVRARIKQNIRPAS